MSEQAIDSDVLPYKHWWGLLGCAALLGMIFAVGPYTDGLALEPDRGDMWYFWQLAEPTVLTRLMAWVPFNSGDSLLIFLDI